MKEKPIGRQLNERANDLVTILYFGGIAVVSIVILLLLTA